MKQKKRAINERQITKRRRHCDGPPVIPVERVLLFTIIGFTYAQLPVPMSSSQSPGTDSHTDTYPQSTRSHLLPGRFNTCSTPAINLARSVINQ